VAESTFGEEDSDDDFADDKTSTPQRGDLRIIDLEYEEEATTTFIENSDDESSSYEKNFVRGIATPAGSVTQSLSSSG